MNRYVPALNGNGRAGWFLAMDVLDVSNYISRMVFVPLRTFVAQRLGMHDLLERSGNDPLRNLCAHASPPEADHRRARTPPPPALLIECSH